MANRVTMIDDDPGKDRDHREHAGCQRQQQAEAEEADQYLRQVGVLQQIGNA